MRFIKQATRFNVKNLDTIYGCGKTKSQKHGPLLPNSIRNITCGPSNCGKTNLLMNLICHKEWLVFENIYLFSKSLGQDKYKMLEDVMDGQEMGYYPFSDNEQVPHPNDIKKHSLMIFDDVSCEKQVHMRNYFTMGRHNDVDTFYLCQTYSKIPKQLIRDNANLIILFKQDDTNLKHVFNDHVTPDMMFDELKHLCKLAWKKDHGFVVICKDFPLNKGRYRIGLDTFVQIS